MAYRRVSPHNEVELGVPVRSAIPSRKSSSMRRPLESTATFIKDLAFAALLFALWFDTLGRVHAGVRSEQGCYLTHGLDKRFGVGRA